MVGARRFVLDRTVDVTGASGTGVVADGVEFPNDVVVLQWRGEHPSTVIWPSIDHVEAINGHDGKTKIIWLDE